MLIFPLFFLSPGSVFAQQQSTVDTLRILDVYGLPGDSNVAIQIHTRNTFLMAAVNGRFIFNSSILILDTVFNSSTQRWEIRSELAGRATNIGPNAVFGSSKDTTGAAATFLILVDLASQPILWIDTGRGVLMNLFFKISPTAPLGDSFAITFQDDPDPFGIRNNFSDTIGTTITPVFARGFLHIQQPPRINHPPVFTSIPVVAESVTQGQTLIFNVSAADQDGDPITLSATSVPANATFPTVQGDSTVTGTFTFTPNFTQEGTFVVNFRAQDTASSNNSATRAVTIVVKKVVRDVLSTAGATGRPTVGGISGRSGILIPVDLLATKDVYGLQFDFHYDPTVFIIDSIIPTTRLTNFVTYDNIGETPGRVRVVTFGLNNETIQASSNPTILNFSVTVRLSAIAGDYPISFSNAREATNPDPQFPSESLFVESGIFTVDRLGDVNLDKWVDVADAVVEVGFIIGNITLVPRQFDAGDVVANDTINVIDLVGIINIIFGRSPLSAPPYQGPWAKINSTAEQVLAGNSNSLSIDAELPADIAGIQLNIKYDPGVIMLSIPQLTPRSQHMILQYKERTAGDLMIVVYTGNLQKPIASGSGEILQIPTQLVSSGLVDRSALRLTQVVLSDPKAVGIPVEGYTNAPLPTDFALFQNYPNPFNPQTTIKYRVAGANSAMVPVTLKIYNIIGQEVKTLVDEPRAPGEYSIIWDGTDDSGQQVSSGVYLYRMIAGSYHETKKMVLTK